MGNENAQRKKKAGEMAIKDWLAILKDNKLTALNPHVSCKANKFVENQSIDVCSLDESAISYSTYVWRAGYLEST